MLIASRRHAARLALLRRLADESAVCVRVALAGDTAPLADCLDETLPDVLLIDEPLLAQLGAIPLRRLRPRLCRLRVLLWCDDAAEGLVSTILARGFHGFLLAGDSPDVCIKAFHAVHRGELWLPRAMLAEALHRVMREPDDDVAAPFSVDASASALLTPREAEVVEHLRQGSSNKEIARALGIMEDTVKKHLQGVFGKLGVRRRSLVMLRQAAAPLGEV